jgi:hypothetical protein
MSTCADRNESLWLEVYGELGDAEHSELDEHLNICADCRQEKKRLETLIGFIKKQPVPSPLTMVESTTLINGVNRKLTSRRFTPHWFDFIHNKRNLWLPAAATVCLLIIMTTYIGYERFNISKNLVAPKLDISKQLPENEIKIIQNLDLLKNLDTLEKLSQVVKDSSDLNAIDIDKQGAQGDIPYGLKERMA